MKTVLVTGGTGFIGSHLVKKLRQFTGLEVWTVSRKSIPWSKNYDFTYIPTMNSLTSIRAYDKTRHVRADLTKDYSTEAVVNYIKPDAIFHLAANPNGRPDPEFPTGIIDSNVKVTQALLSSCKKDCEFVFCSSITVYGDEEYPSAESELKPSGIYAATKAASEMLVDAHTRMGNVHGTKVRLCATVGYGLTHGIIYDFIRKIRRDPTKLEVFGDKPGTEKCFVHVTDVVEGFIEAWKRADLHQAYNVCGKGTLSVEKLAQIVSEEMGVNPEIVWLGSGSTWKGDNKKLEAFPSSYIDYKYPESEQAVRMAVRTILETAYEDSI